MNWFSNPDHLHSIALLRALDAAVADRQWESERRSVTSFYFDTDIVLGAFRDTDEIARILDQGQGQDLFNFAAANKVTFRALWACGFGCKASVLWPHVPEVIRGINAKFGSDDLGEVDKERLAIAQKCAKASFTRERIDDLIAKLHSKAGPDVEAAAQSLPSSFLAAAVASLPTWSLRMKLIGDRLSLSEPLEAPAVEDFMETHRGELRRLARDLQFHRSHRGIQLLVNIGLHSLTITPNTWTDACALLELNLHFGMDPGIRFVTETEAVTKVAGLRSDLFSRNASEETSARDVVDDPKGPFRSNLYMLIRMLVPSLAFDGRREKLEFPDSAKLSLLEISTFLEAAKQLMKEKRNILYGEDDFQVPASGACADILQRFLKTSGFMSVWFQEESASLDFLVSHLKSLPLFGATVSRAHEERPTTIRGMEKWNAENFQKVSQHLRAQLGDDVNTESSEAIPVEAVRDAITVGAGRWIAILYPGVDTPDDLATRVSKDLLVQANPIASRLHASADAVARARAFASASMFALGEMLKLPRNSASVLGDTQSIIVSQLVGRILDDCERFTKRALQKTGSDEPLWKQLAGARPEARYCLAVMLAWRSFHWCDRAVLNNENIIRDPNSPVTRAAVSARRHLDQRLREVGESGVTAGLRRLLCLSSVEVLLDHYAMLPTDNDLPRVDFQEQHSFDAWAWTAVLRRQTDERTVKELRVYVERLSDKASRPELYIRRHHKRIQAYLSRVAPRSDQA